MASRLFFIAKFWFSSIKLATLISAIDYSFGRTKDDTNIQLRADKQKINVKYFSKMVAMAGCALRPAKKTSLSISLLEMI